MNDRDLMDVIETSRLYGIVVDGAARVRRAATQSMVITAARELRTWWFNAHPGRRWRAPGLVLLIAGVVHIALQVTRSPSGWLWLVVPLWAIVTGAVLIAFSISHPSETAS
jgi:uncharacterized membrane protein